MSATEACESIAVILTGGRSTRMGEPKESVTLIDGKPMITHVIRALAPLRIPIYLSTPQDPGQFLLSLDLPIIEDAQPFEGPLAAIANAFEATNAQRLLGVCCDQPLLQASLLQRLLNEAPADQCTFFKQATSPHETGVLHDPFPGVYPRAALANLKAFLADGGRSFRRWNASNACHWVRLSPQDGRMLASFNTLDELRSAGLMG